MPTTAKAVAAILFAALAWLVGETIVRRILPDGMRPGLLREVLAVGGLVIGWRTIGIAATGPMRRGTTLVRAVTAGVAAAAQVLVLGVVGHSFGAMIARSLDGRYPQIGRAFSAWMDFLWQDVAMLADPVVLGTLFGGGALVGLLAGLAGRRGG